MNISISASKERARSVSILGHVTSGMGERVLAYKIEKVLREAGIAVDATRDIIELLGDRYESLAKLNYDLADGGYELIEGIEPLTLPRSDLLLILTWCFPLAALLATTLPRSRPSIAKLYAHHLDERILPQLYSPVQLLMTESLLANERGIKYGIDLGKMLYFPHTYQPTVPKRARREKRRVIGTVCRFEYGKNVEFAIEAVRRLALQGEEVVLYLKGDFPIETSYPEYQKRLGEMLAAYQDQEWLYWDRTYTPFPDVLESYTQFDLLLHPSGAEGGSHIVVECLGLGIPCLLLNCSTNPFLFKGLAAFVETTNERRGALLPHFIPDMEDLVAKLKKEISSPDRGRVEERFHPDVARSRVPLLFEPDPEKIAALYKEDCKLYGV